MRGYTDYPIIELGDEPEKRSPIRECDVISYDGNKYATVIIEGIETQIKEFYLYQKPGRCGSVPTLNIKDLK